MTQPLALVLYEKIIPGSRLVNLLQDLKYRVQTLADPEMLVACAEQVKPMVLLADLDSTRSNVGPAIAKLRQNAATQHIPVIAFGREGAEKDREEAIAAGVTLLVDQSALLTHLPQFLEQALQVE